MIPLAPEKLKKTLGSEVTEELRYWLDEVLTTSAVSRDEYREILSRLDILEKDVSRLNEGFRDLRSEITTFRTEIGGFRKGIEDLRKEMNERFDRMYAQMGSLIKWTVGTIGLFGILITILLIVSQFLK